MGKRSGRSRQPPSRYTPDSTNNLEFLSSPASKMPTGACNMPDSPSTPPTGKNSGSAAPLMSTPVLEKSLCEDDVLDLISDLPNTAEGQLAKQVLVTIRQVLVDEFSKIVDKLVHEMTQKNEDLAKQVNKLSAENINLKSRLDNQHAKIVQTEINLYKQEQYQRRNNVELSGIPESITPDKLEDKVVDILEAINIKANKNDIEACHRLGRKGDTGPRRTIIRFVNRRSCEQIMLKKRNLADINRRALELGENAVYANYSLCNAYRSLWYNAKKLFHASRIQGFWVSKATVRVRLNDEDRDDPGTAIFHQSQLQDLFPDFNFNAPILPLNKNAGRPVRNQRKKK